MKPKPPAKNGASGQPRVEGVPVPDLFDVVTYFRARGDSYAMIANIGLWMDNDRKQVLTAQGLKLWYEAELKNRGGRQRAR
jgi:hypothetical protein